MENISGGKFVMRKRVLSRPRCALIVIVAALAFAVCGSRDSALIEIDFANAAEWRYMLGVDIYGEPVGAATSERFAGTLRAYVQGMPPQPDDAGRTLRARLTDVNLNAPFLPEDEREEIVRRLSELTVTLSEEGITLSDTSAGLPGVFSGAWDILRSPARVIPAMPNAVMTVGTSWDQEQRFPVTLEDGVADGLLYQWYTLDSLFRADDGARVAALSWVFTYRVALAQSGSQRRYPLAGSGRGEAQLDVDNKKLIKSRAVFQVTHSGIAGADINEVVHFEVVE